MFEVQLSENLIDRIKEAIENSSNPIVCWDEEDQFSVEEMAQIRALPKDADLVEQTFARRYDDLVLEAERRYMLDIMERFRDEIEKEADDHVSEEDLREVIEYEDLYSSCPEVDINFKQLIAKINGLTQAI